MLYSNKHPWVRQLFFCIISISSINMAIALNPYRELTGRTLMGIKETPDGGNVTFDCSPSGPCIPCSRSEKSDEKYYCGETGYRIRLKCVPSGSSSKDDKSLKPEKTNQRRLLADSSKAKGASSYVIYRSCIPAVNEERLSVLGFESLMLALVVSSGSFIYFRRKRSHLVAGGVPMRVPTSSRF